MLQASVTDVAQAALNVVVDPCLPDVAIAINRLSAAEANTPGLPSTPTQAKLGIGLCKALPLINGVVYLRENPIVAVAGLAGFLGIFVYAGYKIGIKRGAK